jgi:hypothetical protein
MRMRLTQIESFGWQQLSADQPRPGVPADRQDAFALTRTGAFSPFCMIR